MAFAGFVPVKMGDKHQLNTFYGLNRVAQPENTGFLVPRVGFILI